MSASPSTSASSAPTSARRPRADAQRNLATVVAAAKEVFAESGVDAPMREIAARAGVGVGTIYRHFPQRSDLVKAVFTTEVDAAAADAPAIAAAHSPGDAVAAWLVRYTRFVAAKRGLGAALHSGDTAYAALPDYFLGTLGPVLRDLLDSAEAAGEIRSGTEPEDLLVAVSRLSSGQDAAQSERLVHLLVDGLRYGAAR
ncbi:TetR/AcrR family transcriptional regulator [Schumannella soli]|uniref:Helix-turn-helix transcriptional regulator n=1 Tax=Schumannella soli TaxID=2590779 RepID=A0A506XZ08_9MICO|nr:TetR/AcrR family transcriptional regulator [Schumannella soli]TPW74843.1 helix-turn-helix transcriptional regulator [Schumannella soli]